METTTFETTKWSYLSELPVLLRLLFCQYLVSDNPEQNKKAIHYQVTRYAICDAFSVINCSVLSRPKVRGGSSPLRTGLEERRNLFSLLLKYFRSLKRVACQLFFFPRLYSFDASDIARNGKRMNWHLGIYLYVYST